MEPKYELVEDDQFQINGTTLYRIRALKDFKNANSGDLGGYIESKDNLSQDGNCWVQDNAAVYGNAKVYGNALILDNAKIEGNSRVYGNACVCGDAVVSDYARIYSEAIVNDKSSIFGEAYVCGHAYVCGSSFIYGHSQIYDDAIIIGAIVGEYAAIYGDARVFPTVEIKGNKRIGEGIIRPCILK